MASFSPHPSYYHHCVSPRGVMSEMEAEEHKSSMEEAYISALKQGQGFYDVIVRIDGFLRLLGPGWPIETWRQHDLQNWNGPIVSVIGGFGKGKTYILNQIACGTLPSGLCVSTEGFSFKRIYIDRRQLILLDTAGTNSPI
eukprot:gene4185-108_t